MIDRIKELETELEEAKNQIQTQNQRIRELELRKAQYDSIIDNMTELVERSGPNYSLRFVNKALADFYGYDQDDLIGTNTMDLVLKEDRQAIYDMMGFVNAENPYYHYEYRVRNGENDVVWMESSGRGFYDEMEISLNIRTSAEISLILKIWKKHSKKRSNSAPMNWSTPTFNYCGSIIICKAFFLEFPKGLW